MMQPFTIECKKHCMLFDANLNSRIKNYQSYTPIYKELFNTDTDNNTDTDMTLNYNTIIDSIESVDSYNNFIGTSIHNNDHVHMFAKFCPLFDPLKTLIGKRLTHNISLPKCNEKTHIFSDKNNSAYVDAFFYYLSSKLLHHHGFVHGIDCFGSVLAIQKQFRIDIQDDLEYLFESDYFLEHRKSFNISDDIYENFEPVETRKHKKMLIISDDRVEIDNIITIDKTLPDSTQNHTEPKSDDLVYIKKRSKLHINKET